MQIFLIGFMGSGKTTVAALLAEKLGLPFIDSDKAIEKLAGKTIVRLFAEEGEEHFRELEKSFITGLNDQPKIVACGGGLPCFNHLMEELVKRGKVIYLAAGVETLLRNLEAERTNRPLLAEIPESKLKETIALRLEERKSVYEKADLTVHCDGKTVEELVREIMASLGKGYQDFRTSGY